MTKEKFNDSTNQNLFKEYKKNKNLKIRNNIVVLNQPLVSHIIGKYYLDSVKFSPEIKQDIYQEGIMGLMHAIDKFDINFGFKFSTYASWWIKQKINNYLNVNSIIQIPSHIRSDQSKLFKQLKQEGENLFDLNNESDIEKYNITNKKLKRIKNAVSSKKIMSISSPLSNNGSSEMCLEDLIIDKKENQENYFDKKFMIDTVKNSLKSMPEKRRLILLLRYGVIKEKEIKKVKKDYE